ncbi:MAG: hypothetical protein U0176_05375 [Bacteroidia bacterium]
MKARPIHIACFGLLLLLLWLPFLQERTMLIKEKPLAGVEEVLDSVPLKDSTWFNGKFQSNYAVRMYNWMGLRASMVRLRNQVDFSLFREPYRSVMVGKDGVLFGRGSLETIRGKDFAGAEMVRYHSEHTAVLQSWFAQRNVAMITLVTPSKLQTMPDDLPGEEVAFAPQSNYPAYIDALKRNNVFLIDLGPVMQGWMQSKPHPIWAKNGGHWTEYAAAMAADSIIGRMELLLGKKFVRPEIASVETAPGNRGYDDDLGQLLNLAINPDPGEVGYPKLRYRAEGRERPRVLVVGDSFWWEIYDPGIHKTCFAPGSQYRYYNYETYSDQWQGARIMDQAAFKASLENVDAVVLSVNADNLHRFPFGFVDDALFVVGVGKR